MSRVPRGLFASFAVGAALAAVVAAAVPARAAGRTRCATSVSGGHATTPCYDAAALARFEAAYKRFSVREAAGNLARRGALNSLYTAVYSPPQGGSCKLDNQGHESSSNVSNSTVRAEWILEEDLPGARSSATDALDEITTMIGALGFASKNTAVQDRLHDALESLRLSQRSFQTANDIVQSSANQLKALHCDEAMADYEMGTQVNDSALQRARTARRNVDSARAAFRRAPCKDDVQQSAPASPGAIGAGGAGSQTRSAGKLEILAPRRLRLSAAGATVLPLTLRARTEGFVRIDLSRGKITFASVSRLLRKGQVGLGVRLSRATTRGPAQLRVVFVGSSDRPAVATLSIRII